MTDEKTYKKIKGITNRIDNMTVQIDKSFESVDKDIDSLFESRKYIHEDMKAVNRDMNKVVTALKSHKKDISSLYGWTLIGVFFGLGTCLVMLNHRAEINHLNARVAELEDKVYSEEKEEEV